MSTDTESTPISHDEHDIPRFEPWLAVCLSALVPVIVMQFVGMPLQIPLMIVAGVLLAAGFAMFVHANRRR